MREELQRRYIEAIVIMIVGLVLLLVANSISLPPQYNTFLWIPYEINPVFLVAFYEKQILFLVGLVSIVAGLLMLAFASLVHKPPPPPPPPKA